MFFHKFLNLINNNSSSNSLMKPDDIDFIKSKLSDVHVVLFEPDYSSNSRTVEADECIQEIDLPFDICWFEMTDNLSISISHDRNLQMDTAGLFVVELSPRNYKIYMLQKSFSSYSILPVHSEIEEYKVALYKWSLTLIETLLNRLRPNQAFSVDEKQQIIYKYKGKKLNKD